MGARILHTSILLGLAATFLTSAALADDEADRGKLAGTWQADDGNTLVLQYTTDTVKITESQNGKKVREFECNVAGKECEVSDNGRKSKISVWYNGPKLVELETKGAEVVKRTFSAAGKDDAMEVELTPVVPSGAMQKSHFRRTPVASAQR